MKAIMIRHGEPNYEEVRVWGDIGLGFELGKLTDLGVKQAYERAKDPLLSGANLIVSSPYTRALQTAAILSKELGVDLVIETDLHEWFGDTSFKFDYDIDKASDAYFKMKGIRDDNFKYRFERYADIKTRVANVINKYRDYDKVLFVCHGIVMSSQTFFEDMIKHCGVRVLDIK